MSDLALQRRGACFAAALAFATFGASARGEAPAGAAEPDQAERQRLEREAPAAHEALDAGEAALTSGAAEAAAELFAGALAAAPWSALLERSSCEALLAAGRRVEAIAACHRAVQLRGDGQQLRALAAALVGGHEEPVSAELALAQGLATRAVLAEPGEPWGYAARCDIAHRLGDRAMLQGCVKELNRVAPGHPEAERAERWLAQGSPLPGRAVGWLALVAALLATGADAARRWTARRRVSPRARPSAAVPSSVVAAFVAATVFACLALGMAATAHAEETPPVPLDPEAEGVLVDREDPVSSIPNDEQRRKAPLEFGYFILELSELAEKSLEKRDYPAAIKFYDAVTKAVPEKSIGYAKLCLAHEGAGDVPAAARACRDALDHEGVKLKDYTRYVRLVLGQRGELDQATLLDLEAVLEHLRKVDASQVAVHQLECELAMRTQDSHRLRGCTTALEGLTPEDPQVLLYQWSLAMQEERFRDAEAVLARAKATALDPALLARMERTTGRSRWQGTRRIGALLVGGLSGAGLLAWFGVWLWKRRARSAVPTAPSASPAS